MRRSAGQRVLVGASDWQACWQELKSDWKCGFLASTRVFILKVEKVCVFENNETSYTISTSSDSIFGAESYHLPILLVKINENGRHWRRCKWYLRSGTKVAHLAPHVRQILTPSSSSWYDFWCLYRDRTVENDLLHTSQKYWGYSVPINSKQNQQTRGKYRGVDKTNQHSNPLQQTGKRFTGLWYVSI